MNNQTRSLLASASPRIQAALQDYLDRVDKGEQIDAEAFLIRHAEIADELRSFIAVDQQARQLAGAATPKAGSPRPEKIEGKAPQTKAEVSTHSVVGNIDGTVGGKLKTPDVAAPVVSVASSPADLPEVFGRYRVQKKLGSGAMGAVYLADDTLLDRRVALKTPTFENDQEGELLRRFYREARAVANLKHPNLCAVYDVGEIDGRHYISMEFVRGKKLQDYIKPDKPMAEKQVMAVIRKIALAMHEAHSHGVIHRDLKPDNIMVNEKGEPVVMDFGLVYKSESKNSTRITQRGMLVGSPAYMSKEQVEGDPEKLTAATDQYSLGVILYQLLTAKLPFDGGIHGVLAAILTKDPTPPSQLRPDVNPHLEAICLKMMAKEARDRYPSMKAVADVILEVSKGTSKAAGSVVVAEPAAQSLTDGLTATFAGASLAEPQSLPALKVNDSLIKSRIRRATQKGSNGLLYSCLTAGMFLLLAVIFWVRSGQALVKVEVLADDVQVTFDGDELTIMDRTRDFRVTPGEHTLHIKSKDTEFDTAKFTLKRGENPVVIVEVVNAAIVAKLGDDVISRIPDASEIKTQVSNETKRPEATGEPNNLLTAIDPKRDAISGPWIKAGGELISPKERNACVILPVEFIPDEYQLTIEAERVSGTNNLSLFLVYGGKEAHVVLDSDARGVICSGLNVLNGKYVHENPTTFRKPVLPQGKAVTIVCTVQNERIRVDADGESIIDWNCLPGSFSHDRNWTSPLPGGKFAIGGWESVFKISRISLQPFAPADSLVFQNKRFKLFAEQLTWHEAQRKCRAMGGRLAEVRSSAENDFLMKLASDANQTGLWLGATDEVKAMTWLWKDNSGLAYNYFANGQPDRTKPGRNYLMMMIRTQRGQWCSQPDVSTDWTPGFVCEWNTDDRDKAAQVASPGSVETGAWTELFNGHDLAGWVDAAKGTPARWKVQENYMEATPNVNIMTSETFPLDFQLHAEFWIPKEDGESGQRRGNSGIFLLGRHEIQILDMFENPGNPAPIVGLGALFNSVAPKGVVVRPPETWQAFDITFHAPRTDAVTGKKISGHLTLSHDGKVVIENVLITEDFSVGAQNRNFGNPGPILLQGHVSPVRFRNIRIKELSGMSEQRNVNAATSAPATPALVAVMDTSNTTSSQASAWVSSDGLRIYWEQLDRPDGEYQIWQADRPNADQLFANKRVVGQGRQPTLTPDELQLLCLQSIGTKAKRLFAATRTSISEPFGPASKLTQFDENLSFNSPFISADGLALFVTARSEQSILTAKTFVSRRPTLNAPWSMLRLVDIQWDAVAQQAALTWLAMAPDELSFLATHELDVGRFQVVKFTRNSKTEPFEKFDYLSLPGVGPVHGRTPRYIPVTKELYLTAPVDYSKATTLAGWQDSHRPVLWVIKNVDLSVSKESVVADSGAPPQIAIPDEATAFGEHSYKFFREQLTWKEARAKCESLGGNLVIIDDAEENKFVGNLITSDAWLDSWIGISDEATEGQWRTVNGSDVQYSNWATYQPNNAGDGEHFAIMSNRTFGSDPVAWRWCDQPAIPKEPHQAGFVCEWNSVPDNNPIAKVTETDKLAKWVTVFNGKDLTGWTPMLTTGKDHEIQTPTTLGWNVRKNEIVCETDAEGWLRLDQAYGDCEIEFEFRLPPNSNSGLLVRCTGEGKLYGDNKCEVQLEYDYSTSKKEESSGGIFGIIPPTRYAYKPNVWNEMTVQIHGGQITVRLNDHVVVDAKMADYPALRSLPSTGYFGLFNYMGRAKGCRFRNFRVKDLTRTVTDASIAMPPELSPNSVLPVPNKAAETPPLTSSVSHVSAVSGWIDLLEWSEGIDWKSRGYDWNENCEGTPGKAGITLKPTKGLQNIVPLPAIIEGDYDMEVEFTRHEGHHSVEVFFPVNSKNIHLLLGASSGKVEGMLGVDGKSLLAENNGEPRNAFAITKNKRHRISIRVRRTEPMVSLEVDLDNNQNYFTWSGHQSELDKVFGGRKLTTIRRPWIAAYESRVTFEKVRVRMLSGTIQTDFITQADRDADLAEGFVRLVGEPAIKPIVGFSKFCVNQISMEVANGPESTWPLIIRDFAPCRDFYGAHAPSRLKCPVPKGAKSFTVVGYNDGSRSTKYILYVDGKEIYASGLTGIIPIQIDLPRDAGLLELLVETGGNSNFDCSYWCYPRFHDVASEKVTDKMLTDRQRDLKFEIQSHTVGADKLTYNQPFTFCRSVPLEYRDAKPCDEFLYSVPNASVTYAVPEGMTRFTAIGYCVVSHSVRFEVWADAKQIFASPQVGIIPIDVKLPSDTKTVELKINDLGSSEYDNAMWCYPRLHRK
jgi:predicted Ser/Thr protein kinase